MAAIVYAYSEAAGKVVGAVTSPAAIDPSRGVSVYAHDPATGKVKETKK